MTRIHSLKILILVVFPLLSKIQAQEEYETCDCPEDLDCNFETDCSCKKGYEGNDCEINICDLPDVYQCEAEENGGPVCIKLDKICDDNPDCPKWAEDEKICKDNPDKCIGPIKWCDGTQDCDNNEDESGCCNDYPPEQGPLDCKEGTMADECKEKSGASECMPDECRANVCVPKCDGKKDTCAKLHGISAVDTSCVEYSDLDEQDCQTSCPDGEIQCFSSNENSALPLTCKKPETKCDGVQDCKIFGEDEKDCPTECPEEQWQCSEPVAPLYRECISADLVGNAVKDCNDGSDEKAINGHHISCDVCTCSDEDDILTKCLDNEEEECPNDTDTISCRGGLWWWWIIVLVIILLLILALIIWYCCKNRKKPDPFKAPLSNQDAGSEESQPINQPDQDQTDDCKPSPEIIKNGTILKTPSPIIEIPKEKPSSPPPDFDWEQAAQRIVKDHRKNTAHIHIPPANGFLMMEFPIDRIHEERSVSPQPPPVPSVQYSGPKIAYPQTLDRQVSETGEVVRYAGPTQLPIHVPGRRRENKTSINYADPKDH